ncbi:MAG TPA: hypothetical protein VHE78_11035 [Gemmatimonadaceae bacterium]|nr:hypothetical protein [Gemmatimonadaceae bacterium]
MSGETGGVRAHVAERAQRAARALAHGIQPLPQRLTGVVDEIKDLNADDFPPDLRSRFASIHEAIAARESLEDSIRRMTRERAVQLAAEICDLAIDLVRRETMEAETVSENAKAVLGILVKGAAEQLDSGARRRGDGRRVSDAIAQSPRLMRGLDELRRLAGIKGAPAGERPERA